MNSFEFFSLITSFENKSDYTEVMTPIPLIAVGAKTAKHNDEMYFTWCYHRSVSRLERLFGFMKSYFSFSSS